MLAWPVGADVGSLAVSGRLDSEVIFGSWSGMGLPVARIGIVPRRGYQGLSITVTDWSPELSLFAK